MESGPPAVSPTSDNSMENSEGDSLSGSLDFDDWMKILFLLIALAGLAGNSVVLWLLGFRIRRTSFSVYILNLAAADALFLCCSFLISVDELGKSVFDDLTWEILSYFKLMFYIAGMSLLGAISTQRCLSALFPLWYRCHRPKHTSAVVCAWIWTLAVLLWLVHFVVWQYTFPQCDNLIIIEGAWLLLLTCVMCMSSLTLLLRVQCSSRRRRPIRLSFLVLLTVLLFLLCGLPWGIWDFMHFNIDLIPSWPFEGLACVNSSVNPFIYFFLGRQGNRRREPLRVVLQRALGDEQELGGETTNTPYTSSQETSF